MAITGFKNIPVYDVNTNRIISMDSYCREIVSDYGGDQVGGDFGSDPVATTLMIMMDENYLYEAKIVEDNNGNWISMNEALSRGVAADVTGNYSAARNAYNNNNRTQFDNSFNSFINTLNDYNENSHRKASNNRRTSIKVDKAHFHNSQSYDSRRKAYCIRYDEVDILDNQGNWVFVRYNGQNSSTIGWMLKSDLNSF